MALHRLSSWACKRDCIDSGVLTEYPVFAFVDLNTFSTVGRVVYTLTVSTYLNCTVKAVFSSSNLAKFVEISVKNDDRGATKHKG